MYSTSLKLAREAHLAPGKLALVPHASDTRQLAAIMNCLGSVWAVTPKPMNSAAFERTRNMRGMLNTRRGYVTKTPDRLWEMDFAEWAEKYTDPRITVNSAIVWSPPKDAARHAMMCWRFIKPHGRLVAIIPPEHVKLIKPWVENRYGSIETFTDQDTREEHTMITVVREHDAV